MGAERGGILPTKKCPKIEFILSSCGGGIGSPEKPDKFRKKWSKFDGKTWDEYVRCSELDGCWSWGLLVLGVVGLGDGRTWWWSDMGMVGLGGGRFWGVVGVGGYRSWWSSALEEGRMEGRKEGKEGRKEGWKDGRTDGRMEGWKDGSVIGVGFVLDVSYVLGDGSVLDVCYVVRLD